MAEPLQHASRTLIERGDARKPSLALASRSAGPQRLAIDHRVHPVKADGGTSPEVLTGWRVERPARAARAQRKPHPVKPVNRRRYHAGRHVAEVQIKRRVAAEAAFVLEVRKPKR